jgi:hypothetical protein
MKKYLLATATAALLSGAAPAFAQNYIQYYEEDSNPGYGIVVIGYGPDNVAANYCGFDTQTEANSTINAGWTQYTGKADRFAAAFHNGTKIDVQQDWGLYIAWRGVPHCVALREYR